MIIPQITVAIPLFNMGQIATLCLEGLCNQKTKYSWELLICEEQNNKSLGLDKIKEYEEQLKAANCVNIKYKELKNWVPLGQKWKILADMASDTIAFILQAGDCYPHSKRIENTSNAFVNENCNYYDQQQGYFYSYEVDKTILFNPTQKYTHTCRLNMAWSTTLFKKLPPNDRKRIVDGFLYNKLSNIDNIKKYRDYNLYDDGVDVDGYNMISSRTNFFITNEFNHIFQSTEFDALTNIPLLKNYKNLELTKNKIK